MSAISGVLIPLQAKALLALAKVGVLASRVQRWSVAELK
jgi:hypothetical protein